ncbi:MAG: response regulator transcription factor [Flavobacteriales bacterium]|nr:response regulator transcription factor [Flavobacteriales bacterium]
MSQNKTKILLVEDEPNFGTVLKSYLQLAKYEVDWCMNGKEAFSKFQAEEYQLCILDVMMPEMDGFTLGKELKSIQPNLPFIFLTAKSLKEDILKGFKIGAQDYLTKPFDSDVLLEKIKVILHRFENNATLKPLDDILVIGKYTFQPRNRKLTFHEKTFKLSPKENELLIELYKYSNQVLPRKHALKKIWGDDNYFTGRSMDVYIAKLRKYLKSDKNVEIENIHGNGFQLRINTKNS